MFSHFVLVCQLLDVSYGLQLYQAVAQFIKKISFNFKIFISFQTGLHIYSAQPFYKTNSSNIWVGGDFNLGNIDN
jgi:hypothetical protein